MFQLKDSSFNACMIIDLTQNIIENNVIAVAYSNIDTACTCQANISDTLIVDNENGIVVGYNSSTSVNCIIFIEDSNFQGNTRISLGVLDIEKTLMNSSSIRIRNVSFFNNTNFSPNTGIVQVDESIDLSIEDSCVFRANQGTPVHAFKTIVTISGLVTFEDNVAVRGGGISLMSSVLRLRPQSEKSTKVIFSDNKVIEGGGILVNHDQLESVDSYSGSGCFYEVEGVSFDELMNNTVNETLDFSNNTASKGGLDIYGVTPNSRCPIGLGTEREAVSSAVQDKIFKTSSNLSSISSDPKRVCLCDSSSQLMCANLSHIFYNTTRYPGETFSLPLALVGFNFGTVTGPVYANLLPKVDNIKSSIGSDQLVRRVTHNDCTLLNFTVNSLNRHEVIALSSNDTLIAELADPNHITSMIAAFDEDQHHVIPFPLLTIPIYIETTLVNCPLGFQLTETGKCECESFISGKNCSIYDHEPQVSRNPNEWIAPGFDPDRVMIGRPCPRDYCNRDSKSVDMNNPDQQCESGRTGILCGACLQNLSLAIGSSNCIECDEYYYLTLLMLQLV